MQFCTFKTMCAHALAISYSEPHLFSTSFKSSKFILFVFFAFNVTGSQESGRDKSASKSFHFPLWEESSQNRFDEHKKSETTIRTKCLKEVSSKWIHISLRKCAHMYFTSEFTGILPLVLSLPFDEKEIKHTQDTHEKKDATIKLCNMTAHRGTVTTRVVN